MTEDTGNFDSALKAFLKGAQDIIDADYKLNYPNLKPNILVTTSGKKYVKVISKAQSGSGTSAWAFIDKSNGDILKPATWAAPAKHARVIFLIKIMAPDQSRLMGQVIYSQGEERNHEAKKIFS